MNTLDIHQVLMHLPHRYPFLLVDRVLDYEPGKSLRAIKNVTINEPFFEGHFPGQPIMPGVLIIEAMAQTGGILLLNGVENPGDKLVYFMSINNAKFRKPVFPGDQLVFEIKLLSRRSKIAVIQAKAHVDGNLVAEAELSAAIVDKIGSQSSNNQKGKFDKPKEQFTIN